MLNNRLIVIEWASKAAFLKIDKLKAEHLSVLSVSMGHWVGPRN